MKNNVLELLKLLEKTSTEADKKAILKENENNNEFKTTLLFGISPKIVFGMKSLYPLKDIKEFKNIITLEDAFNALSNNIINRKITGDDAYKFIFELAQQLSKNNAEVLYRVIVKKLQCGLGPKTINAVYKNFIPEIPYMRCSLIDEKIEQQKLENRNDLMLQEKLDGQFVNFIIHNETHYEFISRANIEYNFCSHFNNIAKEIYLNLKKPVVLTGELLVKKGYNILDRQTGNGIIQKACKNTITPDECSNIIFNAWDIIPLNEFYNGKCMVKYITRYETLCDLWNNIRNFLGDLEKKFDIVSTTYCTYNEAISFVKQYMREGKEGGIIKLPEAIWKNGTSTEQFKLKNIFECDLKIIGYNKGDSNSIYKDTLGSLICSSIDGKVICSVSGFKEEMRYEIWNNKQRYLNTVITVAANKLSKNKNNDIYSLYLPRFIEFRNDKLYADDLPTIIEIERSVI